MGKLSGKNVLVTGASSGIGEAIAIRFAQDGARVAINYNSGKERAESVKAKTDAAGRESGVTGESITVKADISKENEIVQMFETVITKSVRLEEAPAYRESIFTFAPQSSGAHEYSKLCEEVMGRV